MALSTNMRIRKYTLAVNDGEYLVKELVEVSEDDV